MTINFRNDLGRTSIKKSTTHIQSSKLFNGRLVWHLIHMHTLKGVVCCNRWQAKDGNGLKLEKVGPTFKFNAMHATSPNK